VQAAPQLPGGTGSAEASAAPQQQRRRRRTLTTGARQLVVQLAAVTMWSLAGSYKPSLQPITTLSTGSASLTGADTTTFLTPLSK
jgi:hypothetical protein